MKKLISIIIITLIFNLTYAQKADTIFTHQKTIICNIKEIASENIKYSYPNENILISLNKNMITKIIYSSGREEVFSESLGFKKISGWEDWEKVATSIIPDEVDGLYKLGDISSKAKGGTGFSNQNKLKNKAVRKIKIRAAMIGANVVYIASDDTEGVAYGKTAQVIMTGVGYSNRIVNIDTFKKLIKEKPIWRLSNIVSMPFNSKTPTTTSGNNVTIDLSNYRVDGLFIKMIYKNEIYRVINIDNNQITLMKQDKRKTYNYILK